MTDATTRENVRRIVALEQQEKSRPSTEKGNKVSTINVSNPPTDAQLTAEFGSPAERYDTIVINDNGGGTLYWLVVSDGVSWLYEQLTKAV